MKNYSSKISGMYEQEARFRLYSNRNNIFSGLAVEEYELVKRYIQKPGRILSIGCGSGREVFDLENLGNSVMGIDISRKMIRRANQIKKEIGSRAEFRVMDAVFLDLDENSFDYITMWNQVFENIILSDDRIKLLSKIREILNKDGILIFSAFNRRYSPANLKTLLKQGFNLKQKLRIIKNYFVWCFGLSLVMGVNYLFNRDYFRENIVYLNKKGRFSFRYTPGAVPAHLHSISELKREIESAGFSQFELFSFEELRYYSSHNWDVEGSVLIYGVCFK